MRFSGDSGTSSADGLTVTNAGFQNQQEVNNLLLGGLLRYVGDPGDNNVIIGGLLSENNILEGGNHLILGGTTNTIRNGVNNSIENSASCEISGNFNSISACDGCVISSGCQYVFLINCTGLTVPLNTQNVTYIGNVPFYSRPNFSVD